MELEIRPDPSDDERAALAAALGAVEPTDQRSPAAAYLSPWRAAGLLEGVSAEDSGGAGLDETL